MKKQTLLVSGIRLSLDDAPEDAFARAENVLRRHRLLIDAKNGYEYKICRRAVDARRRNDVHFVCTVAVFGVFSIRGGEDAPLPQGIARLTDTEPVPKYGQIPLRHRPVIVGSGPAGLFAALLLAENGYAPLLLERGGSVSNRVQAIERFYRTRQLDTETNVQFGAGGAGTFSDGKLMTRVSDPYNQYILRRFVEFGAPEDILWQARPHIGTDYLRTVVDRMLSHITDLGGEIHYHTRLDELHIKNDRLVGYSANGASHEAEALVLAIGHSARDTYRMLMKKPLLVTPKPFSVGMRIEHLQTDIDRALYGTFAEHKSLPHAEYSFSSRSGERGVYTFCMCPGGEVMAATSQEGGLVVNGMSHRSRAGKNANAALAVSVLPTDFGNTPEGAIAYQESIERKAFVAGGGEYSAPLCTVGDFLNEYYVSEPSRVQPTYMGGHAFRVADPSLFLPDFVCSMLREGIRAFGARTDGFDAPDALLTGAETRTSAPLRIVRDEGREAIGCRGLYPAGEGAGYAGGITSAALDGLRSALALMSTYASSASK